MLTAQQRILDPLPQAQRRSFMGMLERLVRAHQDGRPGAS
jgi:hypothetical protein